MITFMPDYFERASYDWSEDSIRFINTPGKTARQIFFYVQEAGLFKTLPPYFTERKNLDSYLLIYTLHGEGTLFWNDHPYVLSPGTLAYINCKQHHLYRCAKKQSWEFLWLHFNGAAARGYYEETMKNGFHIPECSLGFPAADLMQRILSLAQSRSVYAEPLCSELITRLLTQLLLCSSHNDGLLPTMPESIQSLVKYLDLHFTEDLSLDLLAEIFHISKFHLARAFKTYTGYSIHQFLILNRISYAKELLRYSAQTVDEITYQCGMHNVSHFINLFKANENLTPLQYRKKWQENL